MPEEKKHPGGRPPEYDYKDPKEVERFKDTVDKYFIDAEQRGKKFTLSSLAYFLGFDRVTLFKYESYPQFVNTIMRAKARIECQRSEDLVDPENRNVNGMKFDLQNNHKWRESQDINHGGQNGNPIETKSSLDDLPLEALLEIRAIREKYATCNTSTN